MANEIDRMVGARARLLRIDCGLSQQAVAEAIGVSFQQVQKYEKGSNRISASTLVALTRLFKANISDFFVDVDGFENGAANARALPYDDPQVVHVARSFSSIPNEKALRKILGLVDVLAVDQEA